MVGRIFSHQYFQMAKIAPKGPPWLEKFSNISTPSCLKIALKCPPCLRIFSNISSLNWLPPICPPKYPAYLEKFSTINTLKLLKSQLSVCHILIL